MPYLRYLLYVIILGALFFWIYRPVSVTASEDCIYRIPPEEIRKSHDLANSLEATQKVTLRNQLVVYYDSEGCIYVNKDFKRIKSKAKLFKTFIMNPGKKAAYAASPDSSWIIIKAANYQDIPQNIKVLKSIRVELLDIIYTDLRNDGAKRKFGKRFDALSPEDQQVIMKKYPINVVDDLWDQIEDPSLPIRISPVQGFEVN